MIGYIEVINLTGFSLRVLVYVDFDDRLEICHESIFYATFFFKGID